MIPSHSRARINQVVTDDMTAEAAAASAAAHPLDEAEGVHIVVRNGVVDTSLSNVTALPEGVFFGRLGDAPSSAAAQLVRYISPLHTRALQRIACGIQLSIKGATQPVSMSPAAEIAVRDVRDNVGSTLHLIGIIGTISWRED